MRAGGSLTQIVLAEDNPADVGLVREALQEHAIQCDLRVISDGEQALDFVERLSRDTHLPCPDVFLLDLHLPKHDGGEILKHFRAIERCGKTPVVLLTSSDPLWEPLNSAKHEATHYFQKPLALAQFMQLGSIVKELIRPRS